MAKERRSIRDGTGPYKSSFMRRSGRKVGRRREAGEICPEEESDDIEWF